MSLYSTVDSYPEINLFAAVVNWLRLQSDCDCGFRSFCFFISLRIWFKLNYLFTGETYLDTCAECCSFLS